jgi:hypothetical protein
MWHGRDLICRSEIYLIPYLISYLMYTDAFTGCVTLGKEQPSNVRLLPYCTAMIIKHGHAERKRKKIQIKWVAKIRGIDKRSNSSINK